MPARSKLTLACLTLIGACLGAPAGAAGIGEAVLRSHLGQSLRVDIPLLGEDAASLGAECYKLVPGGPAVNDELPWLRDAQITIDSSGTRPRLVVTTRTPVNTPVLMLGVQLACGSQVNREYPLLLTPAPTVEVPQAESPSERQHAPTRARLPTAGAVWHTAAGESAQSLARALFPGQPRKAERYARAIVAANPAAFASLAEPLNAPLPPDLQLGMPPTSAAQLAVAPSTQAPPARTEGLPVEPATRKRATPRPPVIRGADRLVVAGDEPVLRPSLELGASGATPAPAADADRERMRSEQQLLLAIDDRIATQIELDHRVQRLEAAQTRLQAENARLQSQLAQQQRVIRPSITEAPSSQYALYLWLGLATLIAGALLTWRWVRSRRPLDPAQEEPLDEEFVLPPASADEAEFEADALSAADIWPEATGHTSPVLPTGLQAADWSPPTLSPGSLGPSSLLNIDDEVEEHDSAVELAEIMMSFGRVQGAAETLAEFIRANPKQAVKPWVKLLEVYRIASMRSEFDALAHQLNKTFNVKSVSWEDFDEVKHASETIEQIPHVIKTLESLWGTRECQVYLNKLLRDNRKGTRQGFPLGMIDDLLMLNGVLEIEIGPFRASLEEMADAESPATQIAPPLTTDSEPSGPPAFEPKPRADTVDTDFVLAQTSLPDFPSAQRLPRTPDLETDAGFSSSMIEFNLDEDLPPLPKPADKP